MASVSFFFKSCCCICVALDVQSRFVLLWFPAFLALVCIAGSLAKM